MRFTFFSKTRDTFTNILLILLSQHIIGIFIVLWSIWLCIFMIRTVQYDLFQNVFKFLCVGGGVAAGP